MPHSLHQYARRVISGQAHGPLASLLRCATAAAEPFYAAAMRRRNRRFDRPGAATRIARPVISVGNITAGGTGKTPVVQWLSSALAQPSSPVAILCRGYSDETKLLESPHAFIYPNPNRIEAARRALAEHPDISLFIMDDGFQHRRLARDFDLVLIDAANPFGYGHVHPRGLLREPLAGLARADAILLTHASEADAPTRQSIESEIRRHNPQAPIYAADHIHTALTTPDGLQPLGTLAGKTFFAFCGIGNPESFARQLQTLPGRCAGSHFFPDHHPYRPRDLDTVAFRARAAGADLLLTTQKDYVKLPQPTPLPIWALDLALRFAPTDDQRLLEEIRAKLNKF